MNKRKVITRIHIYAESTHTCTCVWLVDRDKMCLAIELVVQGGEYSNREKYDANHYTQMTFIHWPLRAAPKPAQRDEQIAQLISTK